MRIKNGFKNILEWDSSRLSSYNYVDLKMNVIFNNKNNTESQIVEIQFLLDFLLHAKKIGRKYYGIKRKDVQVHSVGNIMYNINNNYKKYSTKILSIVGDGDINQFCMNLFLRPNCILSMITYGKYYTTPYLYNIGQTNSSKMIELFLDCMFHFGEILLNEKKPIDYNVGWYNDYSSKDLDKINIDDLTSNHKTFIQTYLNFSFGHFPCIDNSTFVK